MDKKEPKFFKKIKSFLHKAYFPEEYSEEQAISKDIAANETANGDTVEFQKLGKDFSKQAESHGETRVFSSEEVRQAQQSTAQTAAESATIELSAKDVREAQAAAEGQAGSAPAESATIELSAKDVRAAQAAAEGQAGSAPAEGATIELSAKDVRAAQAAAEGQAGSAPAEDATIELSAKDVRAAQAAAEDQAGSAPAEDATIELSAKDVRAAQAAAEGQAGSAPAEDATIELSAKDVRAAQARQTADGGQTEQDGLNAMEILGMGWRSNQEEKKPEERRESQPELKEQSPAVETSSKSDETTGVPAEIESPKLNAMEILGMGWDGQSSTPKDRQQPPNTYKAQDGEVKEKEAGQQPKAEFSEKAIDTAGQEKADGSIDKVQLKEDKADEIEFNSSREVSEKLPAAEAVSAEQPSGQQEKKPVQRWNEPGAQKVLAPEIPEDRKKIPEESKQGQKPAGRGENIKQKGERAGKTSRDVSAAKSGEDFNPGKIIGGIGAVAAGGVSVGLKNIKEFWAKLNPAQLSQAIYRIGLTVATVMLLLSLWMARDSLTISGLETWVQVQVTGSGLGDGFPVQIKGNSVEPSNFVHFGSDVAVLSDTALTAYNQSGKELYTVRHSYENPSMSNRADRFIVYDIGGKGYTVQLGSNTQRTDSANGVITAADISNNGSYAIAYGMESYASGIDVYGKKGQKIYSYGFADQYVVGLSMKFDGSGAVVCSVGTENGVLKSMITILDFQQAEAVHKHQVPENMLIKAYWADNDSIYVVGDTGLMFSTNGGSSFKEYSYQGQWLSAVDLEANKAAIALSSHEYGGSSSLLIFNEGKQAVKVDLEERVNSISMKAGVLAANYGENIGFFDSDNGTLMEELPGYKDVQNIALSNERSVFILAISEIKYVLIK